ncbi:MAG: Mobile element protein [Nitrospira sp.]|nr:Mobile element protein [Nitrospira sp.]
MEAGVTVKDLCRQHGFSKARYYLWRSKFKGMTASDGFQHLQLLRSIHG